MLFPWYSTMMLTVESSCVIGLRVTKMARGGWEAYNEVVLVVSEKVDAAIKLTRRSSPAAPQHSLLIDIVSM